MPGGFETSLVRDETSSVRERVLGLDVARVLGLGAIVASHTWSGRPVDVFLFSWNVPLFFVLSGYLWRRGRSVAEEIRKRSRSLLVPYIAWYLIVAGTWFTYRSLTDARFRWSGAAETLLGGAHAGRPFSAYWFITALFFACVLLRALERFPTWVPWLVGAVALGACYRDRSAVADLPWSVGTAVACMLFILIGMELRKNRRSVRAPALTGAVLVVIGLLPFALDTIGTIDMKPGIFGSPVLSLVASSAICIGIVLVCEEVTERLPRPLVTPAQPLARSALAVVLGHALILAFVLDTGHRPIGSFYVIFALALVVPWAIGLAALRTPVRRVLLY
jgi:acyltransferase